MEKKKKKFKPVITRVKLNPEQAVLQCSCWDSPFHSHAFFPSHPGPNASCDPVSKHSSHFSSTWTSGSASS